MQPTFSLIYTSVRSERIAPMIQDWLKKCRRPEDIEIIVAVDAPDTKSQAVLEKLNPAKEPANPDWRLRWCIQPDAPFNCVRGWNLAASKATGKVLVQMTDDMIPPDAWDVKLKALEPKTWMEEDWAIHVEDGYVHDIMVLAIITKVRYDRFGYFFYPDYPSLFCLDPATPIWMSDMSFKPIAEVRVGENVVGSCRKYGSDSSGAQQRNFLTDALVYEVMSRKAEIVQLTLKSGRTLKCTSDHFWAYRGDGRLAGSTAKVPKLALKNGPILIENGFSYGHPRVGRKLLHVLEPTMPLHPGEIEARELGWLAGMMDGEGCFPVITQSLTHNPAICAEIERLLRKFGFQFSLTSSYDQNYGKKSGKQHHQRVFTLTGGRPAYVRFLNLVQPLKRHSEQARDRVMGARFTEADEIVAMRPVDHGTVMCLKTASHNYIAGGYLSHNCDTELTTVAYRDNVVINAKHLLFEHRHPDCGKRARDEVDKVHASTERWNQGETLFNFRKAKGFPIDAGPNAKTAKALAPAPPPPIKFCVYVQATRDDLCLYEVCKRMIEEGVNDFFFSIPDEYWSGRPTPDKDMQQVQQIAADVRKLGVNVDCLLHKVKTYRWPGDSRIKVETRVRNDAMAHIRSKGWEHVLIVDGDELWKRGTLNYVKEILRRWKPNAINCLMVPVIGCPGWPINGATDVAVIYINSAVPFKECRTPIGEQFRLQMPSVIHFTGTRRTMEETILKHTDSGHFDDPDYDFKEFLEKVLPNIKPGFQHTYPNGIKGIHFYKKYQIWPEIRDWLADEVKEIPESVWSCLGRPAWLPGQP